MRPLKLVIGGLVMAAVIATLLVSVPSVHAGRGEQAVIHEGQVVAITDTEVTIKEWAGSYTYRLRSGGRQELDGAGIKPGDKVIFSAWEANQIAFDFRKKRAGDVRTRLSPHLPRQPPIPGALPPGAAETG